MTEERLDTGAADRIVGSIVDSTGISRAKAFPAHMLSWFVEVGAGASPSWAVFCVDDHLAFTPSLSVTGDLRLRIDRDRLRPVGDGIRWAPAGLYDQDGTRSSLCTRGVLERVVDALAGIGVHARIGHEVEFTLVGGHGEWAAYGLGAVLGQDEFVADLLRAAAGAGLGIEQIHAEAGAQQFELSLSPTDPVGSADDLVLARILIGRTARAHGMRASFSPVPVAGGSGNGAHVHVSFTRDGRPLLSGGAGPHGMTDAGGSVVAGILRALPGLGAVLTGSVLSHLRLRPGMWAGAWCCWGLENREAAVRLCALTPGNPHGAHLEVKPVDPSANPYLACAAILGAAHAGLVGALPLPAEVPVDPVRLTDAERAALGVDLLPTSPDDLLAALASSRLAGDLFGPSLLEALLAVKSYEFDEYRARPPAELAERFRFAWTT
ncbi:glutamine synthetase family protein [Rhodococcus sp. A5(2022)]|uniref:glutamine synthetase family protein n=1 Tax=Rhodococcus sp. A5(2022) TaxID=3003588 RepID=UPI0022A8D16F|nr:glutamine synthetase family protein [Rhodococcus sp. A5(2022)]MCZ1072838.1 glutamine synthetase family protein [Rhodococcus sp. A5(2022)]